MKFRRNVVEVSLKLRRSLDEMSSKLSVERMLQLSVCGLLRGRGGATADVDRFDNLLASENIVFDNSNRNYPRSADEFNEPYTQSKFVKQWESVKQYTNVKTKQQFIDNVSAVYMSSRPDYAHSKLMQLDLFSKLFTKPKDKQETLLTSMAFLAQKKGKVFGPFGKLY